MACPELRFQRTLGAGLLAVISSCTVFDGLSLPAQDAGGEGGGGTCDPTRLALDAHHCGTCGHDCLGGSCAGGTCQPVVLATASGPPTDLAVDDRYVFWTTDDGSASSLGRANKDGTDARSIVVGLPAGVARIAVDSSRVYFTNSTTSVVYAATKDGAAQTSVASAQPGATPLASDGTALYWGTNQGAGVGDWIARASLGSEGGPTWAEIVRGRKFPREIAVDATSVYWGENYQTILQAPKEGGGSPIVLADCVSFGAMALDDTFVYWTTTTGQVRRSTKGERVNAANGCDAPSARTLAQEDAGVGLLGLALGANTLVYTEQAAGSVKAIPASGTCGAGSCARVLALGQPGPTRVAADARAAYFINSGGDKHIVKVAF